MSVAMSAAERAATQRRNEPRGVWVTLWLAGTVVALWAGVRLLA